MNTSDEDIIETAIDYLCMIPHAQLLEFSKRLEKRNTMTHEALGIVLNQPDEWR